MSDLGSAILILGCLCIVAFLAGCRVSRCQSGSRRLVIQLVAAALLPVYFCCLWDRPILASLLPTSALIILSNWLPLWACFFVGIYATTTHVNLLRRILVSTGTVSLVVYSTIAPSLGTAPICKDLSSQSCLVSQSTPYTCSAASAASLLRLHGIPATESELAKLCLTRKGTHWMGVYRGLKMKTQGTGWTVIVQPFEESAMAEFCGPCVLSLNIDVDGFTTGHDHGFKEDVGHTVVYLGRSARDCSVVFDPSPDFGLEDWQPSTRSSVRNGVILRLLPEATGGVSSDRVCRKVNGMLRHRRLTAGLTLLNR